MIILKFACFGDTEWLIVFPRGFLITSTKWSVFKLEMREVTSSIFTQAGSIISQVNSKPGK